MAPQSARIADYLFMVVHQSELFSMNICGGFFWHFAIWSWELPANMNEDLVSVSLVTSNSFRVDLNDSFFERYFQATILSDKRQTQ